VVPYNPFLSKVINAYIYIEVIGGMSLLKYIYKCVYKGPNIINATVHGQDANRVVDKIEEYLKSR
jgi:hypothetical protein